MGGLGKSGFRSTFGKFLAVEICEAIPVTHTHTHTEWWGVLECVSCGWRCGSQRRHLLFRFSATLFIFRSCRGVEMVSPCHPQHPLPTENHYTGPRQPQRRSLLQSLKLMANKIVCLRPSHAGPTHQDLSLK